MDHEARSGVNPFKKPRQGARNQPLTKLTLSSSICLLVFRLSSFINHRHSTWIVHAKQPVCFGEALLGADFVESAGHLVAGEAAGTR